MPLNIKILVLHSLVLMDKPKDRGVYRSVPVRIMGANHEPPQPYLVPIQMEQLLLNLAGVLFIELLFFQVVLNPHHNFR